VKSGTQSLAAIDTGTTLIGGPTEAVASIYSNIQGSQPLSGQMQGYFSIPCDTSVSTSFSFGSKTWSISPADFTVQQISRSACLGAFFGFDLGQQGGPDWVIGDTFLKNVYSVFRFSPASIGFANLASNLQDPSATAGPPAGSISIGGGPLPTSGGGATSAASGDDPFTTSNPGFPGAPGSGSGALAIRPSIATLILIPLSALLIPLLR